MFKTLNNTNNYKKDLSYSCIEILVKYSGIINEYLTHIYEYNKNICSTKHNNIVIIGLNTITHVFKYLLLTTNNLELSYYHSQKAYYYYIEFMEQIGTISNPELTSNSSNIELNLNAKHASMFVYKQTIFDINRDFISSIKNEELNLKIDTYSKLIYIYHKLIYNVILSFDVMDNSTVIVKHVDNNVSDILQKIIYLNINNSDTFCKKIDNICNFLHYNNSNIFSETKNFITNLTNN